MRLPNFCKGNSQLVPPVIMYSRRQFLFEGYLFALSGNVEVGGSGWDTARYKLRSCSGLSPSEKFISVYSQPQKLE